MWAAGDFALAPDSTFHLNEVGAGSLSIDAPDLFPASAFHLHFAGEGSLTLGAVNMAPDSAFHLHVAGDGALGVAGGAITAVEVEASGWVLAVTGSWGASAFGDIVADPDGSPRIAVTATAAGFNRSGGQAVAAPSRNRGSIVGTKPLRRPHPNQTALEETDLGGGVRKLRIALSRHIHPGEVVTATFASNWRAGLGAQVGLTVTNNSAKAAPLPSFRWAQPSYMRATGAFRVDLLVSHILAEGLGAVAAVKFVAYDGTNTHEVWVDAPSTSTLYGDNLRCWGATLNPTGLTAGLISVHAEVYPWVGAMRRTGNAHSTDNFAGLSVDALSPLHVAWDPAGTRYPEAHVYIDPAGTTTASAAMVQATLADAKNPAIVPVASRAANWNTALQAIYLANRTIAAANGRSSITRAADNAVITLKAGTHTWTSTAPTTGLQAAECRAILQGDPDDADRRTNCIIQTGPSHQGRIDRWLWRNLSFEMGGTSLPIGLLYIHFDNCTLRGKAGSETATTGLHGSMPAGRSGMSMTRSRWWRYGGGLTGLNRRFGLVRNCEVIRNCDSPCTITTQFIADATVTTNQAGFRSGWSSPPAGSEGANADTFLWGCRATPIANSGFAFGYNGAGTLADHRQAVRNNHVNNVIERSSFADSGIPDTAPMHQCGEGSWEESVDCLVEGCTYIGERFNYGYSDPPGAPAAGDTNRHVGNSIRNCVFDWLPTKHDVFQLDGAQIGSWAVLYGVEYEGNVLAERHPTSSAFDYDFNGLRATVNPSTGVASTWPGFTLDRSLYNGGTNSGGGDYRPAAGSPLLGKAQRAVIDVYRTGEARSGSFAAGAEVPA